MTKTPQPQQPNGTSATGPVRAAADGPPRPGLDPVLAQSKHGAHNPNAEAHQGGLSRPVPPPEREGEVSDSGERVELPTTATHRGSLRAFVRTTAEAKRDSSPRAWVFCSARRPHSASVETKESRRKRQHGTRPSTATETFSESRTLTLTPVRTQALCEPCRERKHYECSSEETIPARSGMHLPAVYRAYDPQGRRVNVAVAL